MKCMHVLLLLEPAQLMFVALDLLLIFFFFVYFNHFVIRCRAFLSFGFGLFALPRSQKVMENGNGLD